MTIKSVKSELIVSSFTYSQRICCRLKKLLMTEKKRNNNTKKKAKPISNVYFFKTVERSLALLYPQQTRKKLDFKSAEQIKFFQNLKIKMEKNRIVFILENFS